MVELACALTIEMTLIVMLQTAALFVLTGRNECSLCWQALSESMSTMSASATRKWGMSEIIA